MNDIAFVYDQSKAPIVGYVDGVPVYGGLDGVPARDLTQAEFDALPERWQKAVLREPYYVAYVAVVAEATPEATPEPVEKKKK